MILHLWVAIVGGAAPLELNHGAHVVGVHSQEELGEFLQVSVSELARASSTTLVIIVRTAVGVLGTL